MKCVGNTIIVSVEAQTDTNLLPVT
jgi:hypothetical protein